MSLLPHLDEAQLAALLASRICHDLISPVGAINNALELYDEDVDMQEDALQLIRTAAATASARLQFVRLAFGASGGMNFDIDSMDIQMVAALYMAHEKAQLVWQGESFLLQKNEAKLLLNLLLVANAALVRGGVLEVELTQRDERAHFTLRCHGSIVRMPTRFVELLNDFLQNNHSSRETIDTHAIQFYYTCLLAYLSRMQLNCQSSEGQATLTAIAKF